MERKQRPQKTGRRSWRWAAALGLCAGALSFGASEAQAKDEFETAFKYELGRLAAHEAADIGHGVLSAVLHGVHDPYRGRAHRRHGNVGYRNDHPYEPKYRRPHYGHDRGYRDHRYAERRHHGYYRRPKYDHGRGHQRGRGYGHHRRYERKHHGHNGGRHHGKRHDRGHHGDCRH